MDDAQARATIDAMRAIFNPAYIAALDIGVNRLIERYGSAEKVQEVVNALAMRLDDQLQDQRADVALFAAVEIIVKATKLNGTIQKWGEN